MYAHVYIYKYVITTLVKHGSVIAKCTFSGHNTANARNKRREQKYRIRKKLKKCLHIKTLFVCTPTQGQHIAGACGNMSHKGGRLSHKVRRRKQDVYATVITSKVPHYKKYMPNNLCI